MIMPVIEPMEATPALLLLHMPLGVGSDNTAELAGQVTTAPEIAPGCRFTLTTVVVMQLAPIV